MTTIYFSLVLHIGCGVSTRLQLYTNCKLAVGVFHKNQGWRFWGITCFTAFALLFFTNTAFFYNLEICGIQQYYQHCFSTSICSPDLSVSHFSTSHNIAKFLLLFCLLQWSMIRDLCCIYCKKIMTSWWFRWQNITLYMFDLMFTHRLKMMLLLWTPAFT